MNVGYDRELAKSLDRKLDVIMPRDSHLNDYIQHHLAITLARHDLPDLEQFQYLITEDSDLGDLIEVIDHALDLQQDT